MAPGECLLLIGQDSRADEKKTITCASANLFYFLRWFSHNQRWPLILKDIIRFWHFVEFNFPVKQNV